MPTDETEPTPFFAWLWEPQTLIGLSAVVLSVCGLSLGIYEASLMRQAQRASVWPHVEVGASMTSQGVDLWARNTGVGPARIQAAAVIYEAALVANWDGLLGQVSGGPVAGSYQSVIAGRVLPPTGHESMLRVVADSGASAVAPALRRAVLDGAVEVALCYCSVYDECWMTTLQSLVRRTRGDAAAGPPATVDDCEGAPRSGI